ncbi:hypothetical protein [uncultured Parabacteroides sp.]|uniref:hypothetical protein n=1 Tax=uncultured Parabacteroides sp. TaxID=512312 RepID=UPI00265A0B8F|nr:hypothetical protein [uncultured Parabacteroides sp.]
MNKRVFKLEEMNLPLEDLILEDDELLLIKGGMGVSSSGAGCGCGCDCSNGTGCGCGCDCGGPTHV